MLLGYHCVDFRYINDTVVCERASCSAKYKHSREFSIAFVRNALHSHKAVSANPLGFVRTECFESSALLLAGDGAPEPESGRPAYSPTTADTILHILFHNGSTILHRRHRGRPKLGPTTQSKSCELGLKARAL